MVLWVGDQLQVVSGAGVYVALAASNVSDPRRWVTTVAADVTSEKSTDWQVRLAIVAGSSVELHHGVAGSVHDKEWDRFVAAVRVHWVVERATDCGNASEDMRKVASDNSGHTSAVRVASGVDTMTIDVVSTVKLVDDLSDKLDVFAWANDCVWGAFPAVVDGFWVDADCLAVRAGLMHTGVSSEVFWAIAPTVKAEQNWRWALRIVVGRHVDDVAAAASR